MSIIMSIIGSVLAEACTCIKSISQESVLLPMGVDMHGIRKKIASGLEVRMLVVNRCTHHNFHSSGFYVHYCGESE